MSRRATGLAVSVALAAAAPALLLAAAPAPDASVSGGTLRVLLAERPAAGYFELDNHGASPLTLLGASSPGCASLMLHRSVASGGMEQMRMVGQVVVPPHGAIRFAPGGYHLMCMAPAAGLHPGGTVPVTLRFSGGAALTAAFAVVGARG